MTPPRSCSLGTTTSRPRPGSRSCRNDRHRQPLRRLHDRGDAAVPGQHLRALVHGGSRELERQPRVRLDDASGDYLNGCLPDSAHGASVFLLWDDLVTNASGGGVFSAVTGTAPNRTYYLEWRAQYYAGGSAHAELVLHEGSDVVDVIYGDVGDPSSATEGIQDNATPSGISSAATAPAGPRRTGSRSPTRRRPAGHHRLRRRPSATSTSAPPPPPLRLRRLRRPTTTTTTTPATSGQATCTRFRT